MSIQDLDSRFPIVNADGTPTEYFLRLLKDRGTSQSDTESSLSDTVDTLDELIDVVETLELDDLTDVDTTSTPPTDNQVLSFDDSDSLWKPRTISGGGGVNWTEILTHDFSATPQSTLEIDISGFTEIKLIGEGVDHAASVYRAFQLSTDGGSTWFNTSGDYQEIATTGAPTNTACIVCHSTASSAARTFYGILSLFGGLAHASYHDENLARNIRFAGSVSTPDTILFGGFSLATSTTPSASNFDAGVLTVLGR